MVRRYWLTFAGVLFFLITDAAFEVLSPWSYKILIDNVLGSENLSAHGWIGAIFGFFQSRESLGFLVVIIYCMSNLLSVISQYFYSILTKTLNQRLVGDFSKKSFGNVLRMSIGSFQQKEIGDYIYKISYDTAAVGNFIESGLIPAVSNSLYILFTGTIMVLISPSLSIVAFCMIPVIAFSLWIINSWIGRATMVSEHSNSAILSFIEEAFNQIKNIQAYNRQRQGAEDFEEKQNIALRDDLNVNGLNFLLDLVIGMIIAVGYGVVIAFGIKYVSAGLMSAGLLIVFVYYLDDMIYPLTFLMNATSVLRENYVRVKQLDRLFDEKWVTQDKGALKTIGKASIRFRNVGLSLGGHPILDHANFEIPDGKMTAIVGVNGSGKTTLISMLLRFIEPDTGRILLDGHPLTEYSLEALRDNIAFLPQETSLFDDSIEYNISLDRKPIGLRAIRKAADRAGANDFIGRLPRRFKFRVGQKGLNLSGGQRQRILEARAFMKENARILVLDEPFSSLDVKSRASLMESINRFRKGKTTILITNILDVVEQADNLVLIDLGKIVYAGARSRLREESKLTKFLLNTN